MKSRYLFYGMAAALFFLTGCKEEHKIAPNPMGLKGNVKSLHSQTYDASVVFDNVVEERIWNEFYNFSRNGLLMEQRSYDSDDCLSGRSVHKYVNGNCVRETNYNYDGDISSENIKTYDPSGNKKEEVRRDENGNVFSRFEYEYDKEGRVSEYKYMSPDGHVDFRRVYEYNNDGNVTKEVLYNAKNEEVTKKETIYGANGLVQEVSEFLNGALTNKVLYQYDQRGLLLSTLTIPYGEEMVAEAKCEYEYDDHDNWIKETIIDVKKNQTRFVTKREIVYY